MLLRNKRTGETKEWDFSNWYQYILNPENKEKYECNLSDFMDRTVKFREEWEDMPEKPKEYYYITSRGNLHFIEDIEDEGDKERKQIGNYFETREEAELTLRKLKAWKRLKDKGFRFLSNKTIGEYGSISYCLTYPTTSKEDKDLGLLFSQEDE